MFHRLKKDGEIPHNHTSGKKNAEVCYRQGSAVAKIASLSNFRKSTLTFQRVPPAFFHMYNPTLKFDVDIDRAAGNFYWIDRSKVIAVLKNFIPGLILLMQSLVI